MDIYIAAIFKAILIFSLTLFIMRITGKAGFGKLSPNDATLILIIAAVIGTPLVNPKSPLVYTVIVLLTALFLQTVFARLSLVDKLRPWLENEPTVIILDGKISYENMKNTQFDMDQLYSSLRLQGIKDIKEVEMGILEPSGQFSIIRKIKCCEYGGTKEDSTYKYLKDEAYMQFKKQGVFDNSQEEEKPKPVK